MEQVLQAVDPHRAAHQSAAVMRLVEEIFPLIEGLYIDLHHNPELSHSEHRTARTVAEWLSRAGFEVTPNVGGTGVVGMLRNGEGPTVLLRGDMDAVPMEERTELPYASTARATDSEGNSVPVMHASGHDVHTACLVGAADLLASAREHWRGTLMVVAQPAEETLEGAAAMMDDGLYDRFGRPDVALAQHVGPQPAGMIAHRRGTILGTTSRLRVRVFGVGGHGSRPQATVDPVVIAASTVTRLQTVVAREIEPSEMAVVTVGVLRAGTESSVIPDEAYLEINTRAFDDRVAERLHTAIERIVRAEAQAAGAEREPEITRDQEGPLTRNDEEQTSAVAAAHRAYFGEQHVVDLPEPLADSEDFSLLGLPGDANPVPCVLWLLGATPHDVWEKAPGESPFEKLGEVPASHSPFFAPDREPTLRAGLAALTVGALTYLAGPDIPEAAPAPHRAETGKHAPIPHEPLPPEPEEEQPGENTQDADMSEYLADDPPYSAPPPQGPPIAAPPPTGPPAAVPPPYPAPASDDPPYQL